MCRYFRFHGASWSEGLPLESETGDEREEVLWGWHSHVLLGEARVGGLPAAGAASSQMACHRG